MKILSKADQRNIYIKKMVCGLNNVIKIITETNEFIIALRVKNDKILVLKRTQVKGGI